MSTIDATVGGASANSYLTLAEADAYWADNYHSSTWDALTDDNKNKLLIMATRTIDNWFIWSGSRSSDTQALRWPRYGAIDCDGYQFDGDVIPQDIKDAVSELASYIVGNDPSAEPATKGFSEITVDVITLKIDKYDRDNSTTIPDAIAKMLACLGEVKSRGMKMVIDLGRA